MGGQVNMGIVDLFSAEDRLEITVSQLMGLIKESVKAEMLLNGVTNKVDYDDILKVVTGKGFEEPVKYFNETPFE